MATGPEVDIWRVDLDASPPPPPAVLNPSERERLERLRTPVLRQRWGASRWALREVLGRQLSLAPELVELERDPDGKPRLAPPQAALEFNLSHSASLALIAVATVPVGIDVEANRRQRDFVALADRALDPVAAALVRAADPARRAAVFYAAWTQHEARLKCHGGGIAAGLPATPVASATVAVGGGYSAAVAVPGRVAPRTRCHLLELGGEGPSGDAAGRG